MRSSTALSIIGGGLILQALVFYTFASPLTLQIFPGAGAFASYPAFSKNTLTADALAVCEVIKKANQAALGGAMLANMQK